MGYIAPGYGDKCRRLFYPLGRTGAIVGHDRNHDYYYGFDYDYNKEVGIIT